MKPIDLAVRIIENEADDLWQKTFEPNSVIEYTRGSSIADALAQFVYYVENTCKPEDYDDFRHAWALQIKQLNKKFEKFATTEV